jgi:YHS domain-containing protein
MKSIKTFTVVILAVSILGVPILASAADEKPETKLKPYTLTTCVVSGDKLGEMGKPYVYKYKDREIKFCCKNCVKDFNKEPEKYIKKIEEAEKKQAKADKP